MATMRPCGGGSYTPVRFPEQPERAAALGGACFRVSGHTHEPVALVVEVGDNGMLEFSAKQGSFWAIRQHVLLIRATIL